MTSSAKPEVNKVVVTAVRGGPSHGHSSENWVKFRLWFRDMQADRQTNKQTKQSFAPIPCLCQHFDCRRTNRFYSAFLFFSFHQ